MITCTSCFHIFDIIVTCLNQGIQILLGIQIIKLCVSLIILLLGIQNILYPMKDQRGDTQFDWDTQFDVSLACLLL